MSVSDSPVGSSTATISLGALDNSKLETPAVAVLMLHTSMNYNLGKPD